MVEAVVVATIVCGLKQQVLAENQQYLIYGASGLTLQSKPADRACTSSSYAWKSSISDMYE
jgi:hypothetical protein